MAAPMRGGRALLPRERWQLPDPATSCKFPCSHSLERGFAVIGCSSAKYEDGREEPRADQASCPILPHLYVNVRFTASGAALPNRGFLACEVHARCLAGLRQLKQILEWESPRSNERYGRASKIILNGVSAARLALPNPPARSPAALSLRA
jgi:hypothetical protein